MPRGFPEGTSGGWRMEMEDGKFMEDTQKEVRQGSFKKVLEVFQNDLQKVSLEKLPKIFRRNYCMGIPRKFSLKIPQRIF